MKIHFYKMHGCGNDYIYIDCISNNYCMQSIIPHIPKLSDRNFGIGGDGVVFITKSDVAHCKMHMYNKDGSYSDMCGNALRCIGWLMNYLKLATNIIQIQTNSHILFAEILENNWVKISIPYNEGDNTNLHAIKTEDRIFNYTQIDLGNPHSVIKLDDKDQMDDFDVAKYGSSIADQRDIFLNSTNVEFYQVINDNTLIMRVWERGAGETVACGSGACAITISHLSWLLKHKKIDALTNNKIKVMLKGGQLEVELSHNSIMLSGEAKLIYDGYINLS